MNEEEFVVIQNFSNAYRRLVESISELKKLAESSRNDLPTRILLRTFLYYESHYSRFHKLLKLITEEDNKGMDYVLYRFDDSILKIERDKQIHLKLGTYQYLLPFLQVFDQFIRASEFFLNNVFTITPKIFLEMTSVYRENKWQLFQSFGKRNCIMLHGGFETPNSYWFPSIKRFLENNRYEVWAPQLPDLNQPPYLNTQLPFTLQNGKFSEHTIIIAHSAGCPLTLSILQNINIKIHRAVLVAGIARRYEGSPILNLLQEAYDWVKIRQHVEEIIFINSDDDPWGCTAEEGKYMFGNLGGALIVLHGQGHFGSGTYNQPYREFPLLEKILSLP
ncbi:alpha/beta hydrolase [Candidatus Woesearchaeota archaeon]|nr:alpha/beta hydrolase [Candidatus Woesearchaeota archaeon]